MFFPSHFGFIYSVRSAFVEVGDGFQSDVVPTRAIQFGVSKNE